MNTDRYTARSAECEFKVCFAPATADATVRLKLNGASIEMNVGSGATEYTVAKLGSRVRRTTGTGG